MLGVPNAALRDFLRTFDDVGVGFYPNSTFVHLDARDYDAYWVDYAGPGEPPRYSANGATRRSDRGSTVIRSSADPLELIEGSSDEVHELPPNSTLRDAIGSDAIPPASGTQRKVLDESIRGNTVTNPSDSGPSEPEIERPNPVAESKQAATD